MKLPPELTQLYERLQEALEQIPVCVKRTCVVVSVVIGTTTVVYHVYPAGFIKLGNRWARYRSGLKMKAVRDDDGSRTCYGERGNPDTSPVTLIMLHGFGGNVDNWVPVVKHLPRELHIVVPELPGHGSSTYRNDEELGMTGMARRVKEFIDHSGSGLRNRKLHVIGAAMGGTVAACFAIDNPSYAEYLSLICPAMRTPTKSPLADRILAGGKLPLLATNADDMRDGISYLVPNPPKLSNTILRGIVQLRKPYNGVMSKVFDRMRAETWDGESDQLVGDRAHTISAPTQVIWGQLDRIIDVSGAEVLEKKLPVMVSKDILSEVGHSIFLQAPAKLASLLLNYHRHCLSMTV